MADVLEGIDRAGRDRIDTLRRDGRFFWIDVSLSETSPRELGEALGIPDRALHALLDFGTGHPSARKFHADGQRVVFGFACYIESTHLPGATSDGFHVIEVRVLVSGDYLLTLHEEPASLPRLLAAYTPEGRSDQYVVYAVLDAMVASAFDALNHTEQTLDGMAVMSADLRAGRVRMATLRVTSLQLSGMRRQVAPQRGLFERIGDEITRVEGLEPDHKNYFERIGEQLNRLVESIDAAANAMATLIDLRLNETSYWLTVVATIFLPLTFITGFFGMNFEWMVGEIDTQVAFWLLGIGTPVLGVALIWRLIVRGSPIQTDGETDDTARSSS